MEEGMDRAHVRCARGPHAGELRELAQRLLHRETRGFGLGFGAAGTSGRARFMLCNAGTRPRAPRFNFVQGLWSCGCLCLESDL